MASSSTPSTSARGRRSASSTPSSRASRTGSVRGSSPTMTASRTPALRRPFRLVSGPRPERSRSGSSPPPAATTGASCSPRARAGRPTRRSPTSSRSRRGSSTSRTARRAAMNWASTWRPARIRSLSNPRAPRYPRDYRDRIEFAFFCMEYIDDECYGDFSGAAFIRGQYFTTFNGCCYGAEHWNSTILGHAFHLAVEGGTNLATGRAVEGVGARPPRGDRGHLLPCLDGAHAGGRDAAASRGGPSAGRGRSASSRQRALPGGAPGAARGGTLTCCSARPSIKPNDAQRASARRCTWSDGPPEPFFPPPVQTPEMCQ